MNSEFLQAFRGVLTVMRQQQACIESAQRQLENQWNMLLAVARAAGCDVGEQPAPRQPDTSAGDAIDELERLFLLDPEDGPQNG